MTGKTAIEDPQVLELEYLLDEPPAKTWRALTIPELRDQWLPAGDLADPEAVHIVPGEAISFRMRDAGLGLGDSVVTFRIMPSGAGGTRLRIVHERTDAGLKPFAANSNLTCFLKAA